MQLNIHFVMESQQQTQWCWASVASSVARFFGTAGPSGSAWTQCQIVGTALGVDCCQDTTGTCNRDGQLDNALQIVGHWVPPVLPAPQPYTYIEGQLSIQRPVPVRIQWYGGDGHFVVLGGCDDTSGTQMVDVEDPWYGPSTYSLDGFATAYQSGAGGWSHVYALA
jgi:hypothetical protein